jgi:hypothetical protein
MRPLKLRCGPAFAHERLTLPFHRDRSLSPGGPRHSGELAPWSVLKICGRAWPSAWSSVSGQKVPSSGFDSRQAIT